MSDEGVIFDATAPLNPETAVRVAKRTVARTANRHAATSSGLAQLSDLFLGSVDEREVSGRP
jgi:hypothetical protein